MIEDTLSYRLLKAMKRTRTVIWPVLNECGLHPGQDLLLSELWRNDGLTQTELVSKLGIEAPTVTKALQRLERAGLLRREPARGRRRHVFLTDAGWALQQPVERAWRAADAQLAEDLGEADQAALRHLLGKLTTA